jgi:hypothetical protein
MHSTVGEFVGEVLEGSGGADRLVIFRQAVGGRGKRVDSARPMERCDSGTAFSRTAIGIYT